MFLNGVHTMSTVVISQSMKNKLHSISFRCECLPAKLKSKCQRLTVINMGDGDVEIDGCVLKAKSVERLRKFLFWANENPKRCPKHGVVHKNGGYKSCPK